MSILMWDKPEKVMTTEEWMAIGADSAPPGVYTPNMSDSDKGRWKAKLCRKTMRYPHIEIRKDTTVIVVSLGNGFVYKTYKEYPLYAWQTEKDRYDPTLGVNLHIATAGPIQWTWQELAEMNQAVAEARAVLEKIEATKAAEVFA